MNVLLVTTSYPLRKGSVSGVFVKKLVDALKYHANITVVTPADDNDSTDSDVKIAKYAPQNMQLLSHRPGGIPVTLRERPLTWLLLPPLIISMFCQCIAQCGNKDVIVANWSINGVIAGAVAKLFNIPLITVLRGSDVNVDNGKKKRSLFLLLAIKLSAKVVCVSDTLYQKMLSTYSVDKNKFVMIPNGVDCEYQNIKHPIDNSSVELTTIGNLNVKKGVHVIIEALALLLDRKSVV